jgi:ribosome-binding ATPase YchF (GTP1/OBG family)
VRGASKGEGLGNQFLANIRECDAIAHIVRCFEDSDITHVEGKISPIDDIETIETELMLADLESLEKRVVAWEKKAKGGDKEAKEIFDLAGRCLALLREGKPARLTQVKPEEQKLFNGLGLLSSKPVLYVCNVEEAAAASGNNFSKAVETRAAAEDAVAVIVDHVFHCGTQGSPRLDRRARNQGAAGSRRDPHRFRKGFYSRRDHSLRGFRRV